MASWLWFGIAFAAVFALDQGIKWYFVLSGYGQGDVIYATSVIGLLLNWLIMWFAIDCLRMLGLPSAPEMLAKIIATGVVFFWNFIIRKLVIYKI